MFRHYCVILLELIVSTFATLHKCVNAVFGKYNLKFHICFMLLNLSV